MGPCRLVEPSSCAEWVRLPALRCQGAERDLGSDTEEELREGTVPIPACHRSRIHWEEGRGTEERRGGGGLRGRSVFRGAAGGSARRPADAFPSARRRRFRWTIPASSCLPQSQNSGGWQGREQS